MIVKLVKKPDDPICVRASCGGDPAFGYYCTFRGSRTDVIKCLELVLQKLNDPLAEVTLDLEEREWTRDEIAAMRQEAERLKKKDSN